MNILPKHIAIIMDGNRRWAREHGLPPMAGHRKVADDVLEPLVEHASKLGISYMTVWAFSTENWKRDASEVDGLMGIFRFALKKFGERMHKKGIRIKMIGNLEKFPDDIQKTVRDLMVLTAQNTRITVVFALNYGGRDEILRAINKYASTTHNSQLTTHNFSDYLDTHGIPDPEMIVRTGGEMRLSGFLPWQGEYSELFFPSWYMPEFTPGKLDDLLEEYSMRIRRFGK